MADEILELQSALDDAELRGDAARLDSLLADEMTLAVRLSQVWVRQSSGWRLAALQFSTLGPG